MDYTQYLMSLWIIESTPDGLRITNGKVTEIVIGGYDVASHECIKRNRATLGCDALVAALRDMLDALTQAACALAAAPCTCNDDRDCQRCHASRKVRTAIDKAKGE